MQESNDILRIVLKSGEELKLSAAIYYASIRRHVVKLYNLDKDLVSIVPLDNVLFLEYIRKPDNILEQVKQPDIVITSDSFTHVEHKSKLTANCCNNCRHLLKHNEASPCNTCKTIEQGDKNNWEENKTTFLEE